MTTRDGELLDPERKNAAMNPAQELEAKVHGMKLRWNTSKMVSELSDKPTSQYLAYDQLILRQKARLPILICLHAGAGYGKSHLLCAFLAYEKLHKRNWAVLAPSGVAAKNIGGMTIHFSF